MKIIKHDSRQLILEKKNKFIPFLLIFSLFVGGVPVLIFFVFFGGLGVTSINCQRIAIGQVNCQINKTAFNGLKTQESLSFNDVVAVKFEQIYGSDDDGNKTFDNRIVLDNKHGQQMLIEASVFINGVKGDEQIMRGIESQIRLFLASEQFSVNTNYDHRWPWPGLIVIAFSTSAFVLVGSAPLVYNIISIGYEKTAFNKSTSQFSFETVNLLGKKTEIHDLRQINSAIIEVSEDSDGDKTYFLTIDIEHEKQHYNLDRSTKINIIQPNADAIANFLGVEVVTRIKTRNYSVFGTHEV